MQTVPGIWITNIHVSQQQFSNLASEWLPCTVINPISLTYFLVADSYVRKSMLTNKDFNIISNTGPWTCICVPPPQQVKRQKLGRSQDVMSKTLKMLPVLQFPDSVSFRLKSFTTLLSDAWQEKMLQPTTSSTSSSRNYGFGSLAMLRVVPSLV